MTQFGQRQLQLTHLVTLNFDKSLGKLCPRDGTQVNPRPGQIIVTKDLTKPEQLWYY